MLDDSKVQDAPETPAPVFAFRAFRNALVGTPAADATDDELTVPIRTLKPTLNRRSPDIPLKIENPPAVDLQPSFPRPDELAPPMASPTKSILLTPGTAATRRKTVSFGDGVVDNERKKSAFESSNYNGNISRQWTGKQSDGKGRSQSKLTQSLLEAREQKTDGLQKKEEKHRSNGHDELFDIVGRGDHSHVKGASQPSKQEVSEELDENEEDVTTNLEQPHSQSGIYWKSEFESYRAKTKEEIKKLIQYRSVAKSYARKRELEARRLTEKLRQEEAKVAEMELHVSKLAAGMVEGKNGESKEEIVKELSRQTALAVQYKRKVDSLRRTLQQHGALDSDSDSQEANSPPDGIAQKLRETEKALELANTKLKEAENRKPDMKELQDLVDSSERKANELEKENKGLKQTLARVKEEMSNYEERRKTKEARLKQKEQKLQDRVQEYRNRLDESRQQHHDAEELLKQSFMDEKKHMQDIIDTLRRNKSTVEQLSHSHSNQRDDAKFFPTQLESKQDSPQKGARTWTNLDDDPPLTQIRKSHQSPKKESMRNERLPKRDRSQNLIDEDVALTAPQRPAPNLLDTSIDLNDFEEPSVDLDPAPRPKHRGSGTLYRDSPAIPPSSPPQLPSLENSPAEKPRSKPHLPGRMALSPRPSMVHMSLNPRPSTQYLRTKSSATRVLPRTTNRITHSGINRQIMTLPGESSMLLSGGDSPSIASMKRDAMSAERVAAARRRLRLKDQEKRGRGMRMGMGMAGAEGKENVYAG
ncbi:hypothetical protein FQN52_007270 [Onygenales sp. PD_12]|nr:hypothetical protein FQN52_007270 [Onygenales sp. PD_12]